MEISGNLITLICLYKKKKAHYGFYCKIKRNTYTLGVTHPDGSFKSLPDTVKEH